MSVNTKAGREGFAGLQVGARARVVKIDPDCTTCLRLQELGLTPGSEFEVTKVAPFGDPVEIETRGARFCLRACDASNVCIERVD